MPEYDAFGREIGEDTLAGLGGSDATVRPAPAPEPAEAPPPEMPMAAPPPQRIKVRRSGGLGCFVGLIILAAVVAGPLIAVVSLVDEAGDVFDDVTGAIDSIPEVEPPGPADVEPSGIVGRSMIAKANVAGALQRLRSDGVTSVVRLSVRPGWIEAEAIKGRRARDMQFSFDGSVRRGDASRVNPASGSIPLARVDPGAPARLVRNAAKRFRVRERGIDYLIASHDVFSGGGHRWVAYFKNGIYVEGDERGRVVRRIN